MKGRKRGFEMDNKGGFYFKRNKVVLESASSKAVFFGVLLLFSVVVVLAGLEIKEIEERNKKTYIASEKVYLNPEVQSTENLILKSQEEFKIEYDFPSYLPEYLRNPRKIFSGRDIRIVRKGGPVNSEVISKEITLSKRDKFNEERISMLNTGVKKIRKNYFTFNIPKELETGHYSVEFKVEGREYLLPLDINGLAEENTGGEQIEFQPDEAIISIKNLGCGYCFWESVMGINPYNDNYGYFIGGGGSDYLVQTNNGWQTHQIFHIDQLVSPFIKNYRGDPKLAFTFGGDLVIASLFQLYSAGEPITGGIYRDSSPMNFPAQLTQTVLQDVPENLPPEEWLLFDYEKIAIDTYPESPYFNSIYVFVNSLWFDEEDEYGSHIGAGFFTVRNNEILKKRGKDVGFNQPPQSAIVAPGGVIHIGRWDGKTSVFSSFDGGESFVRSTVDRDDIGSYCVGRVSRASERAWNIYRGPELAVDTQGRLYAAWAKPKECLQDPNFEYNLYGYDYDVYVSYSDDNGSTWSQGLRINDDYSIGSYGDQGFPDIAVDENGTVYVVFLDHRDDQEQAQFDVYLSHSIDRALSFSINIKLNNVSTDNRNGGRDPGDYLDMITVGENRIFVSYPCMSYYSSWGGPTDACVTTLSKPLNFEPQQCGNNIPETGEECDDGNRINGDSCDINCKIEICGNGIHQFGEQCDDGNIEGDDYYDDICNSDCKLTCRFYGVDWSKNKALENESVDLSVNAAEGCYNKSVNFDVFREASWGDPDEPALTNPQSSIFYFNSYGSALAQSNWITERPSFDPVPEYYFTVSLDEDPNINGSSNNLRVMDNGSDLSVRLWTYEAIIGKENEIRVYAENSGLQNAKEVNVTFFRLDTNWNGSQVIENSSLIGNLFLGDLAPDENTEINFTWTPNEVGYQEVRLIINGTDDFYIDNNQYNAAINVKYNASDIRGWIQTYQAFYNQPNIVSAIIYNNGAQDAHNVLASLYEVEGYWDPDGFVEESSYLIDEVYAGDIISDMDKRVNFTWVPNEAGMQILKLSLNAEEDGDLENNEEYGWVEVINLCGNSILEEGEQCDDGNLVNGDGCSSSCGIETHYKVFVTSSAYNGKIAYGNYFGVNAADMLCNAKARDAGYAYSKKWKAWLSDSKQNAASRLYHSSKAYRTKDMSIVANNWNDLVDGSLDNPINLDERGNLINSGIAWSGSLENGESSSYNCKNWTSNMINDFGNSGYINNTIGWSGRGADKCSSFNRIYCFEQPSCGNGFVDQSNEQCDDGNADNGDGCGTDCRLGSGGGKGSPKDITPPRDGLTA